MHRKLKPELEMAVSAPPRRNSTAEAQDGAPAYQFIPMWDVQREAITNYRCETVAGPNAFESLSPSAKFEADLAAAPARVHHAAQSLSDHLKIGQRFLMTIPISYDLLSSPVARMELTAICRNLSAALRPYLVFEIGDLHYGVPHGRLTELIASLRPFCRGVTALLSARLPSYGAYQGAGLHAIGISLAPGQVGALEMGGEARRLCAAAKHLHVRSFMLDVPDLDTLRIVCDLGANALSSPMIGLPLDRPAPLRRLAARDIPGLVSERDDFIGVGAGERTGIAG